MIGVGVGKSGSPMPRLMIFTPRAMASCFILSIAANRYGGNVLIRVAYSMGKPDMLQNSFPQNGASVFNNAGRSKSPSYKLSAVNHELLSREVIAYSRKSAAINLGTEEMVEPPHPLPYRGPADQPEKELADSPTFLFSLA